MTDLNANNQMSTTIGLNMEEFYQNTLYGRKRSLFTHPEALPYAFFPSKFLAEQADAANCAKALFQQSADDALFLCDAVDSKIVWDWTTLGQNHVLFFSKEKTTLTLACTGDKVVVEHYRTVEVPEGCTVVTDGAATAFRVDAGAEQEVSVRMSTVAIDVDKIRDRNMVELKWLYDWLDIDRGHLRPVFYFVYYLEKLGIMCLPIFVPYFVLYRVRPWVEDNLL